MRASKRAESHIGADLMGWASTSCAVYENMGLNRLIRPMGAQTKLISLIDLKLKRAQIFLYSCSFAVLIHVHSRLPF
jgi:hypothetical protein